MDDLKKLGQSFVDAAKIASPTSYIPEVANYAKAGFMAPIIKAGVSAGAALSGQRGQEADAAEAAARAKQEQSLKDKLDPGKYSRVRKADGGFSFLDPSGKEIGISDYAQITGQTRADILKDSENPIDQEYVNDYINMNNFAQAIYNNDTNQIAAFKQQNKSLANQTPSTIMQTLIKKYPHLYGKGDYSQTFSNRGKQIFNNDPAFVPIVDGNNARPKGF